MAETKKRPSFNQRVAELQDRVNAPKSQYNSFGKYHYRNVEDIMGAAKPLCVELGLMLTVTDEIVTIGDYRFLKATATLHDSNSDQSISACGYARDQDTKKGMDAAQITGSTSSYARKYALGGLLLVDDLKDADSMNSKAAKPAAKPKPQQDWTRYKQAQTLLEQRSGMTKQQAWEEVTNRYGNLKQMSAQQFNAVVAAVTEWAESLPVANPETGEINEESF